MRKAARMLPSSNLDETARAMLLASDHLVLRFIVDPVPLATLRKGLPAAMLDRKVSTLFLIMWDRLCRLPPLPGGSIVWVPKDSNVSQLSLLAGSRAIRSIHSISKWAIAGRAPIGMCLIKLPWKQE